MIDPLAFIPDECRECDRLFDCPLALLKALDALSAVEMAQTTLN